MSLHNLHLNELNISHEQYTKICYALFNHVQLNSLRHPLYRQGKVLRHCVRIAYYRIFTQINTHTQINYLTMKIVCRRDVYLLHNNQRSFSCNK